VLYVAAERAAVVKRRFAAFGKHHKIKDLPLAIVSGSVDLHRSQTDAELIVRHSQELSKITGCDCRLVAIDTISRVLAGGDENSPKDMGLLVRSLAFIQNETGVHLLGLHHIPTDGAQRMRGHGALLAAVDTTVRVERVDKARSATVDFANDGPEGERVVFDLADVVLDEPSNTRAPVVIPFKGPMPNAKPKRKLTANGALALRALHSLCAERGEKLSASFGLPTSIRAIPVNVWRHELEARGVIDKQRSNPRQEFRRIKVALMVAGAAAERDELIWSIQNEPTA
jgi:hypothetical protein